MSSVASKSPVALKTVKVGEVFELPVRGDGERPHNPELRRPDDRSRRR